jgi:nicotinate-nucleotide adenylyltransferase
MTPGRRICLFGGTFDPIHNAHLQIADEAQKRFALDRILFVPAANPPHKQGMHVTPFEDRFEMVRLACEPYPAFFASRLEEGAERSYSIDTLERFCPQLQPEDELFFLIGADAFDELATWKRWQDVIKLTQFIVVSRPGKTYAIPPGAKVLRLDDLSLPVASTTIRTRLRAGQRTPELPDSVRQFIEAHGLYRAKRLQTREAGS